MKILVKILFLYMFAGGICACSDNDSPSVPSAPSVRLNLQDSLAIVDIYNSTYGGVTWAKKWDLKDFNTWHTVKIEEINGEYRVVKLQIADNSPYRPSGIIPESIGNLSELTNLYIASENIQGNLPSSIGKLQNLRNLQINGTRLVGFPPEVGKLHKLERLYLWSNQFEGELPKELGNLPLETNIWIWYNNFSGTVPLELLKNNRMKISLDHNNITELPWDCWLNDEYGIPSLMYNRLSGAVPEEVLQSEKWREYNDLIRPQQDGYGYDVFK